MIDHLSSPERESLPNKHAVLTFVLLDTANVALLEKRAVEGLLPDTGPVTMEETLEPTGGLLEPGEDEMVAGGDAGLDWLLRLLWVWVWLPRLQGWMWR